MKLIVYIIQFTEKKIKAKMKPRPKEVDGRGLKRKGYGVYMEVYGDQSLDIMMSSVFTMW